MNPVFYDAHILNFILMKITVQLMINYIYMRKKSPKLAQSLFTLVRVCQIDSVKKSYRLLVAK